MKVKIQKYRARINGTNIEVIGYISEVREELGQGTYGTGIEYVISVTQVSMPRGRYGTFKVEKESIEPVN